MLDHLPAAPVDQDSPLGLPQRPVLITDQQPAGRFAEVATAELAEHARDRDAQLRHLLDRQHLNSTSMDRLRQRPSVSAAERRMAEVAERAEQIGLYRQELNRAESLHQMTQQRAAEIATLQARIADGGRRAGREADQLAELQARQAADHAAVGAAGQVVQRLRPVVGSDADQARILAEHEHYRLHQDEVLRGAAAADDAELHGRVETARSMDENIAAARTELDEVHAELDLRPDVDQVVSAEQIRFGHMPRHRSPAAPARAPAQDRDIER